MTRIFDTLTTRLFHLRADHLKAAGQMDDLERHLRMGRDWVNEREAEMAEKFARLFPAAFAEPVVEVPPVVLDEHLAIGKIIPLIETKTYSDGTTATGAAPLPALSPAQQDGALAFPLRGPERRLEDHGPQGGKELRVEIRRQADYEDRRDATIDRRVAAQRAGSWPSVLEADRRLLPVGADHRAPPACA